MEQYGKDDAVTADWDSMQTQLRCCGGMSYEIGYQTWANVTQNSTDSDPKDVPDR